MVDYSTFYYIISSMIINTYEGVQFAVNSKKNAFVSKAEKVWFQIVRLIRNANHPENEKGARARCL
jgi:hypothetical protein